MTRAPCPSETTEMRGAQAGPTNALSCDDTRRPDTVDRCVSVWIATKGALR